MKPIQTEYKGVVYRSKSEAIFSRAWGQCHKWGPESNLQYEPEFASIPNYTPDFAYCSFTSFGKWIFTVIEYKPRRPTVTYISQFAERLKAIDSHLGGQLSYGSAIYWSNGFGCSDFGVIRPVLDNTTGEWALGEAEEWDDLLKQEFIKATKYRFDLQ